MGTENLKRMGYPDDFEPTLHHETLIDWDSYLLPLARMMGSSLHTWGVAEGLTVSATADQVGLTISPGVGISSPPSPREDAAPPVPRAPHGQLISLHVGGRAIIVPQLDEGQVQVPTVPVDPNGVQLPTTTRTEGDYFVTIQWYEVKEGAPPNLLHTPWLRLESVAKFTHTGQLILARVTLDSNSHVTALTPAGRRLVGVPVERVEFSRVRSGAPGLSIDQIASAEVRSRTDGGVELNLLPAGGGQNRQPLAIDGATGNLWLAPQAGNVGIGTTTPAAKLQVTGGAIMPAVGTSAAAGIQFPPDPGGGGGDAAFIRYFAESGETTKLLIGCTNDADDRIGFYQFGAERLTIYNGNVGIGTTDPSKGKLVVDGGKLAVNPRTLTTWPADWGDGIHTWDLYGEGTVGAGKDGNVNAYLNRDGHGYFSGNVGIGTSTPAGKLDVQGDIRAGNSDIYFTKTDHKHSGIGNATGHAAIENASDFDALMILGRAGTDTRRKVKLWDYLEVNGSLDVTGDLTIGSGKTISSPGRLHISGEESLYLLNKGGVIVSSAWGGNGNLTVSGDLTIGSGKTISSPGRFHISGEENLYLLNKGGVIVSKAWQGNGNLTVEGNLTTNGDLAIGSGKTLSSPGRLHISGEENLYLLNKGGVIVSRAWGGNGQLEIEGVLITHAIGNDAARNILANKSNGTVIVASAGGVNESRVDFYYKFRNEVHVASIRGGRLS